MNTKSDEFAAIQSRTPNHLQAKVNTTVRALDAFTTRLARAA
jgi:hypothetical protein